MICRITINNLYLQIRENEIELSQKHKDFAYSKLENIRGDIIFDFVSKMMLSPRIDNNFYKELAQQHVAKGKYHEAALIIHKFKFAKEFDIDSIMEKLVD